MCPSTPWLVSIPALALVVNFSVAGEVGAQDRSCAVGDACGYLATPPGPEDRPPELWAHVRAEVAFPNAREHLCPAGVDCVLGGGGGLSVQLERRWPFGLGVFLGYGAFFVDSNGVFELGILQSAAAGVRMGLFQSNLFHPYVEVAATGLLFGDTLQVATVGGGGQASLGVEIEVSDDTAVSLGVTEHLFTVAPFTTGRDGAARAESPGLAAVFRVHVGITLIADGALDRSPL